MHVVPKRKTPYEFPGLNSFSKFLNWICRSRLSTDKPSFPFHYALNPWESKSVDSFCYIGVYTCVEMNPKIIHAINIYLHNQRRLAMNMRQRPEGLTVSDKMVEKKIIFQWVVPHVECHFGLHSFPRCNIVTFFPYCAKNFIC